MEEESHPTHAGMAAIVGRANVGKSTLINALLEEKVSIVSPVAQTTRNLIRGILTEPRGQLVFLDTPGVHRATADLGRVMNRIARASIDGVDAAVLVLDASTAPGEEDEGWMKRLARADIPLVFALNKMDDAPRHAPAYRALWNRLAPETGPTPAWAEISALEGKGLPALLDTLFSLAPIGPPLFPADILTDYPRKLAIADTIREKLFLVLREELPHAVAVWVESIDELPEGQWDVSAVIYVNKATQKPIVLGHKGRTLRSVKRAAEAEASALFDRPVRIRPWIKIEPHWARNHWLLKQFGYVE